MLTLRKANERGHANFGWLDTYHTFSFSSYYDPRHMGFRALRVINDDRVSAGAGFPTHPHRDMEIITYVLSGAVEHRDSMGTGSVVRPGEVQRMSAGTGVTHSEFNPSKSEPLHLLQIWLLPAREGQQPSYEQRAFPEEERRGKLRRVADPEGREGAVTVHQDATLFATLLAPGQEVAHDLAEGRHAFVHVARGHAEVNGERLGPGDGAALSKEAHVRLRGAGPEGEEAEVLVFDLA